jgi:peptide chain release factor subunit 1
MLDRELRQLVTRDDSESPFLSLYIDTNRHDEQHKDRIRVWIKDEAKRIRESIGSDGRDDSAVEKGINQIQHYVENALEPTTRGLAVFVCPKEDLFIPIQLPVPVDPQLNIGTRPHLRPLLQLRQSYPLVLVALVDGKSARLFELELGRILFELDLEDPERPRRHDQGGWSQANMQRHVDEHTKRHHKEVAETVAHLVDQGRVRGVIVSGQERNVANFRSFFPKRVEELTIGTLNLDIHSSADEITAGAQALIHATQNEKIATRLVEAEEAARKQGKGALGINGVADAINQRRVETLFLSANSAARGWRCTRCGMIGYAVPLGCPACGGTVRTVDLIEEFISGAEKEDARLEFVGPGSLLERYEGVGASLRF